MGWWRPVPEAWVDESRRPTCILNFLSGKTQAVETHMWTFGGLEFWVGAYLMANLHITLTVNETVWSCAFLVLNIRKYNIDSKIILMSWNSGPFTEFKFIRVAEASKKQDLHTGKNGNDPSPPFPASRYLHLQTTGLQLRHGNNSDGNNSKENICSL